MKTIQGQRLKRERIDRNGRIFRTVAFTAILAFIAGAVLCWP